MLFIIYCNNNNNKTFQASAVNDCPSDRENNYYVNLIHKMKSTAYISCNVIFHL